MFRRFFALLLFCFLFSAPAFAGFDDGRTAYDKGHWVQAIINLRPLAEAGDARAMILLGNMYMEGHGVSQDTKEAFGLYHSAALLDNTDGMVAVATLYQTGNGVPANTPLAVGWFERAARLGNMDAALVYAIHMYQGSKGKTYDIKPDHGKSYRWFKIVAAHSTNKKQVRAGEFSAGRIESTLTNDEKIAADRDISNWKPEEPADIGPNPEAKFLAEHGFKAPDDEKDDTPGDKKPDVKKPDDKKSGSTDVKPGVKKSGDTAAKPADVKPDDAKAGDKKPDDAKPADQTPDDKKSDDTKSDEDSGDDMPAK